MVFTQLKKLVSRLTLVASCAAFASALQAEDTLTFSYWTKASAPFVFVKGNKLEGGIIRDLGEALASKLGKQAEFINLPSRRIEPYLISGDVDFDCVTNPIWKDKADAYRWSPALFDGADRFLVREGKNNDITAFIDLKGKILGIYQGYVYHPDIMSMIDKGEVATVKVSDVEKGVYLLGLKRIDALIDFGVILAYQIKDQNLKGTMTMASHPADTFKLHCAYSHKVGVDYKLIDNAFRELSQDGSIQRILGKYR